MSAPRPDDPLNMDFPGWQGRTQSTNTLATILRIVVSGTGLKAQEIPPLPVWLNKLSERAFHELIRFPTLGKVIN
jgi:hypothetical protein